MYVMPLLLATLLGVIGTQLDKLLISIYFTADQFAVYANGAIELPLVGVITGSLAAAIMPELVAMGEQGNYAGALSLWHESIRKSSLVLYPFLGYFAACAVDFVHLAYGPGYEDATWPFLLLLTVLPVRVAVFGNLLRAMNRNLPIALGAGIGLAVDVVVSLLLLWAGRGLMLSFLGPAIGSVLAVYVSVGYLIWCIGGTMAVSTRKVLPWRDLMKILSISLGAGLAAFLVRFAALPLAARLGTETGMLSWLNVSVDSAALVIRLGVQTAVFTAVLAFLIWVTGCLKPDEKELLWLPIRWAAVRFKRRPSRL
jgi:O-antigen/teichoic acid export membrane protein